MRAAFSRIGSKISCDANTVTGALVCAALIGRRVFILAAAIVAAIAIVNRLRQRDPVSAAEPATAIGDGLAAAFATLPASGPRGIVLVTDGTNNRGEDPGEVATGCAQRTSAPRYHRHRPGSAFGAGIALLCKGSRWIVRAHSKRRSISDRDEASRI